MRINVSSYISGSSPVHVCDARVKIVLLAAYSITLFFVRTWTGLAACALLFFVVAAVSRIPLRRYFALLVPVYVIVGFTILFNGFAFDVSQATASGAPAGLGNVSAGVLSDLPPIALVGSFGFVPAGFARGCFFALRIVLLVVASLVVTYTTTSTELTAALGDFLRPLRRLRLPVDDIATVFSLALRFIPVTAEEFGRVHDAQQARGAAVLIPLFVGLFRRADALATAMDARCYGAPEVARTSLADRRFAPRSVAVLAGGLAVCAALAALL